VVEQSGRAGERVWGDLGDVGSIWLLTVNARSLELLWLVRAYMANYGVFRAMQALSQLPNPIHANSRKLENTSAIYACLSLVDH
jgi:hypothetical protein